MAYILGFITADGCVYSGSARPHSYLLNITSKDKILLENILSAMKATYTIGRKENGRGHVAYQFQIRNKILTSDLMNLGIVPRKTCFLQPMQIPSAYFKDFLRGFFDGDGTVYIYNVNGTPQIKSAFIALSKSFLSDLNKKICDALSVPLKNVHDRYKRSNSTKTMYEIDFYIHDCEKLFDLMYGHNPSLFLGRKRRIFEQWSRIKRRSYNKKLYPSRIGTRLTKASEKRTMD